MTARKPATPAVLQGADLFAYQHNRLADLAKQQAEVIASNPKKYQACTFTMARPEGRPGPENITCFGWADVAFDRKVQFNGKEAVVRLCPRASSHNRLRTMMASLGWTN